MDTIVFIERGRTDYLNYDKSSRKQEYETIINDLMQLINKKFYCKMSSR